MENADYMNMAGAACAPKPISEHQASVGRLDESIQQLGKHISLLLIRLEPVTDPRESVNKLQGDGACPPSHPVLVIRDMDRLESCVAGHLRLVKEAIDRLVI